MNTLDASVIDNNPDYNDVQFVSEVQGKLQRILRREFPESYQKQQIKKS